MSKNTTQKIWFFAAIGFIIAGILAENTVYIILGCAYICIGLSIRKKTTDKDIKKE